MIISRKFHFLKLDSSYYFVILLVVLTTLYSVFVKRFLFDVKPINLAIAMYFCASFILFSYNTLLRRKSIKSILHFKNNLPRVIIAFFFAAMGTFLLYQAVSIGNASKVYPLSGIQSVFVFLIASSFLRKYSNGAGLLELLWFFLESS